MYNQELNQTTGFKTSNKYQVIKTGELLDKLQSNGYEVTKLEWAKVRRPDKQGFQKHLIRLTHPSLKALNDGLRPELIIINSYDGQTSFNVMLGIYRFICSNGLIVGNSYSHERVRHIGQDTPNQVISALEAVSKALPRVNSDIELMQSIKVTNDIKHKLLDTFLPKKVTTNSKGEQLEYSLANSMSSFKIRRLGDNSADLFTTMNVFQENYLDGRYKLLKTVRGLDGDIRSKSIVKGRAVKSITASSKFNQLLWGETLKIAQNGGF